MLVLNVMRPADASDMIKFELFNTKVVAYIYVTQRREEEPYYTYDDHKDNMSTDMQSAEK